MNDPDAIMFSGRHISVNWTIMGRSSLCYLMNGLDLMKGRRLGPNRYDLVFTQPRSRLRQDRGLSWGFVYTRPGINSRDLNETNEKKIEIQHDSVAKKQTCRGSKYFTSLLLYLTDC